MLVEDDVKCWLGWMVLSYIQRITNFWRTMYDDRVGLIRARRWNHTGSGNSNPPRSSITTCPAAGLTSEATGNPRKRRTGGDPVLKSSSSLFCYRRQSTGYRWSRPGKSLAYLVWLCEFCPWWPAGLQPTVHGEKARCWTLHPRSVPSDHKFDDWTPS